MRTMLMLMVVLGFAARAWAVDPHPDYRYALGECYTWGSGKYAAAKGYLFVGEKWDVAKSWYPVNWSARSKCRYIGCPASGCCADATNPTCFNDADPTAKAGEYRVEGKVCAVKTVIPRTCTGTSTKCSGQADCPEGTTCDAGTGPAVKSWPWMYTSVGIDYNGGGTFVESYCKWDPWAYSGTPPAP